MAGPRDESVEYEQDRLGNERRKLDEHRAQEGMSAEGDNGGIVEVVGGEEGTNLVAFELPQHADEFILDEVHAHNNSASDGTFSIFEATLDSGGNITGTTRRSVPIEVVNDATRIHSYEGEPFDSDAIAVSSEFTGFIGVGGLSDHKEYSEPASEQTS